MIAKDSKQQTDNKIKIVEVGPRDGLQNEKKIISTDTKLQFIEKLVNTGITSIEVGAMVSPKWVPQMAGSEAVCTQLARHSDVNYSVLVPNMQGLARAIAVDMKEIAVFLSASETFSQKNINCSIEESLQRARAVIQSAKANQMRVRGYVSCVLGCPYEGNITSEAVIDVATALIEAGADEIALGDTIGIGTPGDIKRLLRDVLPEIPVNQLAVHFHDTYGQALVNTYTAIEQGICTVDSSIAGLGGCPYAIGASGNLATEDLVYMLHGMGLETGIDLPSLIDTGQWISKQIGRHTGAKTAQAMQ